MSGIPCADCGRALSAHWVRTHWARMPGRPVCNCCRSSNVPVHPTRLQLLTGAPYTPSGEPMSGSVWSDPFLEPSILREGKQSSGASCGNRRKASQSLLSRCEGGAGVPSSAD